MKKLVDNLVNLYEKYRQFCADSMNRGEYDVECLSDFMRWLRFFGIYEK